MDKEMFLRELERRISQLPQSEREKSLAFYAEMIDDMTEDGCTEEEAVERLGSVQKIAEDILLDAPIATLVKTRTKYLHRLRWWEIVLIVIGSVVWLPLLIAVVCTVLCIYAAIWAVIIAVFGVVLALGVSALAIPFLLLFAANVVAGPAGIAMGIGAMLILAGLAVLVFMGAVKLAKCLGRLAGAFGRWIKRLFIRKEEL